MSKHWMVSSYLRDHNFLGVFVHSTRSDSVGTVPCLKSFLKKSYLRRPKKHSSVVVLGCETESFEEMSYLPSFRMGGDQSPRKFNVDEGAFDFGALGAFVMVL